ARGNYAETVEQALSKGDKVVVEGRLQMTSVQANDGSEKKIMELDLSSFEIISSSNTSTPATNQKSDEVVKFAETEM
ncbi:single-stranded DNA-binding protein, partial [bacterium]|nr:single-stranded DNA-binding protein [bacterium]